jgi:hypothetical protein
MTSAARVFDLSLGQMLSASLGFLDAVVSGRRAGGGAPPGGVVRLLFVRATVGWDRGVA